MTDPSPHLCQLGQDAHALWRAGATQHEVLAHVAIGLNGWTRTDDDHIALLAALDLIRQQIHDNTPA
ncbi:hypothetical protein AB0P12_20690 [Streptomyces subrutilus]|uniref:hypothetical protein n=1 Tax=Streptomyces subrutilus TaxID=36818 RepID=UPI00342EB3EB